eukprot:CAMPEP_0197388240 /NCGR_PEP_ID=MMETSP1165-20131217/961_1 /TAXON_ID=284809 /ORGANISM="Chrysocystis fragilis, Strain CCMP3189" /LENGTH=225 /DNA_ID=CAMNT_0042913583 /DNA_START=232 /DNA_END=909 /DNA_ORIENTATION=-
MMNAGPRSRSGKSSKSPAKTSAVKTQFDASLISQVDKETRPLLLPQCLSNVKLAKLWWEVDVYGLVPFHDTVADALGLLYTIMVQAIADTLDNGKDEMDIMDDIRALHAFISCLLTNRNGYTLTTTHLRDGIVETQQRAFCFVCSPDSLLGNVAPLFIGSTRSQGRDATNLVKEHIATASHVSQAATTNRRLLLATQPLIRRCGCCICHGALQIWLSDTPSYPLG